MDRQKNNLQILTLIFCIAVLFLPVYLYAEGSWWEDDNVEVKQFKVKPNSFEDPHHHPVDVHENLDLSKKPATGKKAASKFKKVTIEYAYDGQDFVMSADGKFQAFSVFGNPCRIFIRDTEQDILYEITGVLLENRPFSDLVWVKDRYLVFDRWSNPHYGMHYIADTKEKKVIYAASFPDEFSLSQGRPGYQVKSRFIEAAAAGDIDAVKKDLNSPYLNKTTKALALLWAADKCNEVLAGILLEAGADGKSVVTDWGKSPLEKARRSGCDAVAKMITDLQGDATPVIQATIPAGTPVPTPAPVTLVKFGNYNSILKVQVSGIQVSFTAVNGQLIFDEEVKKWAYDWKSNTSRTYCGPPNYHMYEKLWPEWLKKSTYPSIIAVDNEKQPGYMLVQHVDEGGNSQGCEFADYNFKRGYKLRDGQYTSFSVNGDSVWIGSCFGLFRLDLRKNMLEKYLTLPACTEPVGIARYEDMVYFTDRHYGIFGINKKTNEFEEVCSVYNVDDKDTREFTVMGQQGGKFYAISTGYGCTAGFQIFRGINLHIYDMVAKELIALPTGSGYADKMQIDGDDIVFYGALQHNSEGDMPTFTGSIMVYDTKKQELSVLGDLPVHALWKYENGYKTMTYFYNYDSTVYVECFLDLKTRSYKILKVTNLNYQIPKNSSMKPRTKEQQLESVYWVFGVTATANAEFEELPSSESARKQIESGYTGYQAAYYRLLPDYKRIMELLKVKVKTVKVSTENVTTVDY